MNITEATERACKEPTLLDALSFICIWETERVVKQAKADKIVNPNTGARWETCFKVSLKSVMDRWGR